MPKKRTAKRARPARKNTSFLETHNNLKWLVPLLIIVLLGTAFIIKHRLYDQDTVDNSAVLKQEIKQEINQRSPIDLNKKIIGPSTVPTHPGF
jgi:uncharacterized membrane protein